jgi:tetratricopeptide (TPR) repeat protein
VKALLTTLMLLVALPLSAAKAPGWAEPYERALGSIQRQDWAGAADSLQKAIAANDQEELNANTGKRTVNYLPHYWLGSARLNLNDAEGALAALKRSESQGVIQKTDQYAAFRKALARVEQMRREQSGSDGKALRNAADQAVARALGAQALATGAGASRRSEYQLANRKLDQALVSLRGTPSATQMQAATRLASEAEKLYESVAKQAAKPAAVVRKDPVAPPVTDTRGPGAGVPLTQAPEDEGDAPAADVERVEREIRELETETAAALQKNGTPSMNAVADSVRRSAGAWRAEVATGVPAARLRAISVDISRKMAEVRSRAAVKRPDAPPLQQSTPAVGRVDDSAERLRAAYRELSSGRLAEAEAILDQLVGAGPTSAAAYALRGCVRYTRALLGEKGPLARAAASDFATAIRLDPSIKLDGRYFSPKLVAFFDQARAAAR